MKPTDYHCKICHQTFSNGEQHVCGGTVTPCQSSCQGFPVYQVITQSIEQKLDIIIELLRSIDIGKV